MIQSAWMWLKHQLQSALSQWFCQRTEGHAYCRRIVKSSGSMVSGNSM
jgi:hypothetical protein